MKRNDMMSILKEADRDVTRAKKQAQEFLEGQGPQYDDGKYLMRLVGVDVGRSKKGNKQLIFTWKFVGGEYSGKLFRQYEGLETDRQQFTITFLDKLGFEIADFETFSKDIPVIIDEIEKSRPLYYTTLKTNGDFQNLRNPTLAEEDDAEEVEKAERGSRRRDQDEDDDDDEKPKKKGRREEDDDDQEDDEDDEDDDKDQDDEEEEKEEEEEEEEPRRRKKKGEDERKKLKKRDDDDDEDDDDEEEEEEEPRKKKKSQKTEEVVLHEGDRIVVKWKNREREVQVIDMSGEDDVRVRDDDGKKFRVKTEDILGLAPAKKAKK